MPRVTHLLAALLAALSLSARAESVHDAQLKLTYSVPDAWKEGRTIDGKKFEALIRKAFGGKLPAPVTYTGARFSPNGETYIATWFMKVATPITKLDLSGGAGSTLLSAFGVSNFKLDRNRLLGVADLPAVTGIKNKMIVQFLKGQYSYIGFYYKDKAKLGDFDVVRKSVVVDVASRLSWKTLPKGSGGILAAMARGALIGGVLGGLGALGWWWFVYRKKQQQQQQQQTADANSVAAEIEDHGAAA